MTMTPELWFFGIIPASAVGFIAGFASALWYYWDEIRSWD